VAFWILLTFFDVSQSVEDKSAVHAYKRSTIAGILYTLCLLPCTMCILLIGNILENAVRHLTLDGTQRWLFCGSVSIVLVSFVCMQLLHKGSGKGKRNISKPWRMFVRTFGALVILLLPLIWTEFIEAWLLLFLVNGVLSVLVIFDAYGRHIHPSKRTSLRDSDHEHH